MHTSTLPVGTGSVVEFESSTTCLEPASETLAPLLEPLVPVVGGSMVSSVAELSVQSSPHDMIGEQKPPAQHPAPRRTRREKAVERETPRGAVAPEIVRKPFPKRTASLMGLQIVGCGSYVPEQIVTNADLRERFGFDPEWIEQRTGIFARRYARPEQATSDLAVEAAKRAIESSGVNPRDIDLLVVGTFTPDHICPSTACLVQEKLGLDVPAFDVSAACSGFMYALTTASQFVATGNSKLALVIGADCCSRIINPLDTKVAPLFGDGAGAVLVSRGSTEQGLLCYQLGSDGAGSSLLECPSSGTRHPVTQEAIAAGRQFMHMDGRNVFMWAVRVVEDTIRLMLEKTGLRLEDVSLFLMHQANARILDHAVEKLGVPREKVMMQVDRYGNTSAGSIPLVLDEAHRTGRIKSGDNVLMCGFGAGLTWGTAMFRW